MQPCRFYLKNKGKEGFICEYDFQESVLYFRVKGNKDFLEMNTYANKFCPKFAECVTLANETFRKFRHGNTVINDFGNGKIEVIRYCKEFKIPEKIINDRTDRKRSFRLVNMDFLVPLKKDANLTKLHENVAKSATRAHDKFRALVTANKWSYFFTFTFSPVIVPDRYNDYVLEALWHKKQLTFKYFDSGVKILNVGERHEDLAKHFHALITFSKDLPIVDYGDISNLPQRTCKGGLNKGKTGFCTYKEDGTFTLLPKCSYKYFLVPYYDYGELQRSSLGDILFCLNKYEYGRSSCAILPGDDTNQEKVGNYLSVYTTKESNLGYNKKRYMATRNLADKTKTSVLLSEEDFTELLLKYELKEFKSNDRLCVFRNFNLDKTSAIVSIEERLKR